MSLEGYIKSRAAFVAVEDDVTALMRRIRGVSEGLKYRRTAIRLTGTSIDIPAGEGRYGSRVDNHPAEEWPSAEAIMELLAKWHQCRKQVNDDWASLGKDEQAALQKPPEAATGEPERY